MPGPDDRPGTTVVLPRGAGEGTPLVGRVDVLRRHAQPWVRSHLAVSVQDGRGADPRPDAALVVWWLICPIRVGGCWASR